MKLGSFFHGPQLWRFIKKNIISKQKVPNCSPMGPHFIPRFVASLQLFCGSKTSMPMSGFSFSYVDSLLFSCFAPVEKQTKNCWHCYTGLFLNCVCCMHRSHSLDYYCFHVSGGCGMSTLLQYCIVLLKGSISCS